MGVESNINQIKKALYKLEKSGVYDVDKYTHSLMHQTSQLEYFYCHLVKEGNISSTYYKVNKKPTIHQLAYFNIGRGFPKELMDGHWCYIVKDLGYKMLVIPCTSLKDNVCNNDFEMDIDVIINNEYTKSRIQLSDIRSIDIQRLDLRKSFGTVLTKKTLIHTFIKNNLL